MILWEIDEKLTVGTIIAYNKIRKNAQYFVYFKTLFDLVREGKGKNEKAQPEKRDSIYSAGGYYDRCRTCAGLL
jgi:hypothetical protein